MKLKDPLPILNLRHNEPLQTPLGLTEQLSRCYITAHPFACVLMALYGIIIITSGIAAHQHFKSQSTEQK